ncbi:hypothetical protein AAC387_Pa06g2333 [Persea americana]
MSLVLGSGHSDGPNASKFQGDENFKAGRKYANFHPSVWGNHFITPSPDDLNPSPQMEQRASELKEEVKKMLGNVKSHPLQEINLIDAIQRLGVAYHFEKEVADALLRIYNEDKEGKYESEGLHTVALRFRLLRQEGYCVSSNVLIKFKDELGNFKQTLAGDIRGLLSLCEASHFVIHGEDILDEANAFTGKHLKLALPNLNSPLSSLVQLALELPLRKSIERLLSRYYISIYREEDERNDILLEFAKLDFNLLQSLHKEEIREISMWWRHWDFGAKLPFIRDRVVECYFWILEVYSEPQHSRARRIMTKCISLTSILDDIYDAYDGTLEELELYTNAIQRWDRSIVEQLPDVMKLHFLALLDAIDKFEEDLALDEKSYRISFLKDAFKEISKYYLIEARWFNVGYVPTYEEYMSVALVTCGYKLLTLISFVGMGDTATKEAFEWARSMPKLIKAVSMVNRLRDDITSNKMEQERGHVVSSIEVYMKEHGGTYEETCTKFREMVADAWKDINEECLKPTAFPMALLIRPVNLARVIEVLYQHRDEYTESTHQTKERISLVLVNPIPV